MFSMYLISIAAVIYLSFLESRGSVSLRTPSGEDKTADTK